MKKVIKWVLMLCLILSGAWYYANGADRTEKKGDGTPVEVIEKTVHGGTDKSGSIVPTISSHILSVVFTDNLGQVAVEVSTTTGIMVDYTSTITPNGIQLYIPSTGDYVITFTLPNGDEYYGEFSIID